MTGFSTINEFLREYPMGKTSLYREVQKGTLRLTKLNRATRIAKADALAWANKLPTIGGGAE